LDCSFDFLYNFARVMVMLCRYILLLCAALFCNSSEISYVSEIGQACCIEDVVYDSGSDFVIEQSGLLTNSIHVKVSREQSQKRLKQNSRNSLMFYAVFKLDSFVYTLKNNATSSPFLAGLITNKHSHLTILRRYII
jgi:hypothetical protein